MKKRNVIFISLITAVSIFIAVMIVNAGIKTDDERAAISPSVSVAAEPAWTAEPTQKPTPAISASPSPAVGENTDEQIVSEDTDSKNTDDSSSSGGGSSSGGTSPKATPAPQPTPTAENPAPIGAPTPCPSEDAQQTIDDTHDWIDDNHPTPAPPDPDLPGIGNW